MMTIDETLRRRAKQLKYNEDHGITPQQIIKDIRQDGLGHRPGDGTQKKQSATTYRPYIEPENVDMAADPIVKQMSREQLEKSIADTTALMKQAAKNLDFLQAAQYRDEIIRMKDLLKEK